MRAAVVTRYGPPEVVRIQDVSVPEPRPGEVRVQVTAAAVSSGDARIRAARFPPGFAVPARLALGLRRPRRPVLGGAYAGVVHAVGDGVTDLSPGDAVCGMAGMRLGAHAEYLVRPAETVARRPDTVSDIDAAAVLFGGTTAWWFLHDRGRLVPGMSVLVNGASGAVGTNAVQLAHHGGAAVSAVCSSANAELVTRLGADRIIDHTRTDVRSLAERFDLVLDTVGNLDIATGRRLLAPGGRLLLAVAGLGQLLRARGDVTAGSAPERVEDYRMLVEMVATGELEPVIDQVLPFEQIVEAHRRVDTGHKVGNVVVTLQR